MSSDPVRILHLSDFHFGKSVWDSDPVLRDLATYIAQQIRGENLTPDLIVITGDLAQSGKAADYEKASDWLEKKLWRQLPPNFPRDRLLIVPGNHDVDRDQVKTTAKSLQNTLLNPVDQDVIARVLGDEEERNTLIKRHDAYLKFMAEWTEQSYTVPWWSRVIEIRGVKLHFAGLDSAFMAHCDDDRGNLLLGLYQINETVSNSEATKADWRITLLHHPWDYFAESDMHEAKEQIHLKCDLVLRGHLHNPQSERTVPPDPKRSCLELAAGCVYSGSRYPNAFQWIELYKDPGKRVKIHYRLWQKGEWITDRNQPGCDYGHASFDLTPPTNTRSPSASAGGNGLGQVAGSLTEDELRSYRQGLLEKHDTLLMTGFKTRLRVPIRLDELYVPLYRPRRICGRRVRQSSTASMRLISAWGMTRSRFH